MVILKSAITVQLSSHNYSLFTEKGYQLTKRYTVPKTYLGMGRYAAYKNFGESVWRIGYGSESIDDHYLDANDKASQDDIDKQFYEDLKLFSTEAEKYVFVNLNRIKEQLFLVLLIVLVYVLLNLVNY